MRLLNSKFFPLLLINIFFVSVVLLWINLIPFNDAPDEANHYNFNVKFIVDNKSLPVSGVDDLEAYNYCRDNIFGKVQCAYSYTIYPALNYVVSALSAVFFHKLIGAENYLGARIASLFWGLVYVNFLYLSVKKVTYKQITPIIITIIFSFIPQVNFISSYINQDIHSLAISALLVYTTLNIIEKQSKRNIILFGVASGLLLASKYNYFIYIPFVMLLLSYISYKKSIGLKRSLVIIASVVLIAFVVSGVWFIRNFMLYEDFLGQSFVLNKMKEFHEPGVEQYFNLPTIIWMVKNGFFSTAFNSFFAMFGYMNLGLEPWIYSILYLFAATLITFMLYEIFSKKDKKGFVELVLFVIFFACCFGLFLYNSLKYDYQPQGRYLFPVIIPLAILLSKFFERSKQVKTVLVLFMALILSINIMSSTLLLKTYANGKLLEKIEQDYQVVDLNLGPPSNNHIVGGIQKSGTFDQTFLSTESNLAGINLFLSTFMKKVESPYYFVLKDAESNTTIIEQELKNYEEIKDNDYFSITFPPIESSENKRYSFSIYPKGEVTTPVTIQWSAPNIYTEGQAIYEGNLLNEDVIFQLLYKKR